MSEVTEHGSAEQKAEGKQQRRHCLALSVSPSAWDLHKSVTASSATDSKVCVHTEQQEPGWAH